MHTRIHHFRLSWLFQVCDSPLLHLLAIPGLQHLAGKPVAGDARVFLRLVSKRNDLASTHSITPATRGCSALEFLYPDSFRSVNPTCMTQLAPLLRRMKPRSELARAGGKFSDLTNGWRTLCLDTVARPRNCYSLAVPRFPSDPGNPAPARPWEFLDETATEIRSPR